jgi:hypothetical protein
MKKLLLSLMGAFLIFSLNAQVSENFSDYEVGGKLAKQANDMGRDYWTTWDNQPGTAQDGEIVEINGNKAVHSSLDNDQVLKLGNNTSGEWILEFKLFIPSGKGGYFNILSVFAGANSQWATQAYFGIGASSPFPLDPGVGKIDAGGAASASFTFNYDEWVNVKIFADLNSDKGYFYINGKFIHTWKWTDGCFGGTQTVPKSISGFSFFPPNPSHCDFYVDDIFFGHATLPYETGFDDLPNGSFLAQSSPDWWTTFYNKPGTSEDAKISSDQFSSAPQSVKLVDGNDLVFKAQNQTSGKYNIDFELYIPGDVPAYFNGLQVINGDYSTWAFDVFFNLKTNPYGLPQGTFVIHNDEITNFTLPPPNTWIAVRICYDLDNDKAALYINGEQILEWKYSIDVNGDPGIVQLGGIDFWPPVANSVFYIDNFKFYVPAPNMNVSPLAHSATIIEDAEVKTAKETITISNTGTAKGTYKATIEAGAWLTIDGAAEGNVDIDNSETFDVVIDATEIAVGEYEGKIIVETNDEGNAEFVIICTLKVEEGEGIYTINGIETEVFPNPASDFVTVQCSKIINSIQIINNMGQVVNTITVNNNQTMLDTSNLSAGVYFIKVITDVSAHSSKLIIK